MGESTESEEISGVSSKFTQYLCTTPRPSTWKYSLVVQQYFSNYPLYVCLGEYVIGLKYCL